MERERSGFHDEPGPGVSNRKAERNGRRVVFDGGKYHVVDRSEGGVRRGPGRYSGEIRTQPVPVRAAQA